MFLPSYLSGWDSECLAFRVGSASCTIGTVIWDGVGVKEARDSWTALRLCMIWALISCWFRCCSNTHSGPIPPVGAPAAPSFALPLIISLAAAGALKPANCPLERGASIAASHQYSNASSYRRLEACQLLSRTRTRTLPIRSWDPTGTVTTRTCIGDGDRVQNVRGYTRITQTV